MDNPLLTIGHAVASFWWIGVGLLILLFWKKVALLFGVVVVPQDRLGIVTKKFKLFGSNKSLPDGHIIALRGEAGIQADTLAPGLHLGFWAWQYNVDLVEFTEVEEGTLALLEARDGAVIDTGRVFAKRVDCDSYQDTRAFLTNGGERGPQIEVLRPGSYRINTSAFFLKEVDITTISENKVGLVTTRDGAALATGDIAGPEVAGHHSFQDGQAFIDAGGYKGRQEQVLLAGNYYLNPDFVTVELVDMTDIPIGYVGVVIAFVGKAAAKKTGVDDDRHANIVSKGERGVWDAPLDPGKYPVNTYIQRVELVPTTNIVLNWATAKTESHNLDRNLSTITVRSADGFSFNLDVSQIIHISPSDASKVIARFGSMQNLVTQVLEPLIGNYFRNSAQSADIIAFLQNRAEQQGSAKGAIEDALRGYAVQAVDTLIGDIAPPEELMKTLTDRKVASQREATYAQQRDAEVARQELEQASARANTTAHVVDAARAVEIAELNAQASVKTAEGAAKAKTINASADANVLITVGEATAKQTAAVGSAEASVLAQKVEAVGREAYAAMQIADYLSEAGIQLTPQVMVSGGGESGRGSVADALIGVLMAKAVEAPAATPKKS